MTKKSLEPTSKSTNVIALSPKMKPKKCALCNAKASKEFKPFCSKRCADLDLGKWLNNEYRIPTEDSEMLIDDGNDE